MSGIDLTDQYVNGSVGGTANIVLENGAMIDLMSVGLPARSQCKYYC